MTNALEQVPRWGVFERPFTSEREIADPLRDVRLTVHFTAPDGTARAVEAFWDGGRTWRARFCPDAFGTWRYRTDCSDAGAKGLHGETGSFECVASTEPNPLYRHGLPRLSFDRRHFVHADGTPFFWLGDTAWNGALKSEDAAWERYLSDRRAKGFTVIQLVMTQWRAALADREGQVAFTGREKIAVNPAFFQRMDRRLAAVNRHGLVVAPILLWAIRGEINPGYSLPEEQAILLARYLVARYGAYHVVWILAGDGDYGGENAGRWKRIGRAVFHDRRDRLATMHPVGQQWIADEFRGEEWFDFLGYQSGHGVEEDDLRWLVAGPPSTEWRKEPPRPIVNLEPNYEGHLSYRSQRLIDPFMVRRACYFSLLVTPTAGVTYGHHGVWFWPDRREVPLDHPSSGEAPPWHEAMAAPGSDAMRHLRRVFDTVPWWRLRPAPELLAEQPGAKVPSRFIAASRSEGSEGALGTPGPVAAVIYTPEARTIRLRAAAVADLPHATWFDPRTGERHPARESAPRPDRPGSREAAGAPDDTLAFTTPSEGDWVLVLTAKRE